MKVVFIGHPGSGKTYAATMLAKKLNTQAIDIDDLLHNPLQFLFKAPYRKAFRALIDTKPEWIIDGYGGTRMPGFVWDEADCIIYLRMPKLELRQNIYERYKRKKNHKETTHGQHLFANVLKNLWQIYIHDSSLRHCVQRISRSKNAGKLVIVQSRHELERLIEKLSQTS